MAYAPQTSMTAPTMYGPKTPIDATRSMTGMDPNAAQGGGKGGGQAMTAPGPMTPPGMMPNAPMSNDQFWSQFNGGVRPPAGPGLQGNPNNMPNLPGSPPAGGMTQGDFRTAVSTTQPAISTAPTAPTPAPGAAPNVYDTAANLYNTAAAGPNINQFLNPYTSEVIDRTGMDMARRAAMDRSTLGSQATQARAFGGSRHGIAEGTMLGEYGRAFGDMAAQQRQQGFNTALSAAQGQQGIQGNLANLGFGFGNQLTNAQGQQGADARKIMQDLIDAGKGQYGNFTGAPNDALATLMAAVTGSSMGQQSQTTTKKPGVADWLSAGASIIGGLL